MGVRGYEVGLTGLIRNIHEFSCLHSPSSPTRSCEHTHMHAHRLVIQILISAACTCDSDKQVSASNNLAGNKSLWWGLVCTGELP